jgi:hypothetical protein
MTERGNKGGAQRDTEYNEKGVIHRQGGSSTSRRMM